MSKIFYIFAACSKRNKRPKIRKKRDFNKCKKISDNENNGNKARQMRRVISMATSLHFAIEELMSMMIAEDEDEDFNLIDPKDEALYLALDNKAGEIDALADMVSASYKSTIKQSTEK